ncbi:hypothetical protein X801_04805 [Opisthorchis viverrini]|uniref:RNA-binding protein 42 n=1 Tax=Opisthorchis viverrini TaxID=6198 RepID=A0A1S8WXZ6_OPIVI|nr:hypothetical protein X801_04805 [Opisthorchis viverrini]
MAKLSMQAIERFEAEIAHQTVAPLPSPLTTLPTIPAPLPAAPATLPAVPTALSATPAPLTGGFTFPAPTAFIPHQLQVPQQLTAPLHLTSAVPMYLPLVQPTIPTFQPTVPSGPLPVQHRTVVTNVTLPTISPSTTTTSKSTSSEVTLKVITAPPQMAGPTELAERAKEAATAAAKSRAAVDEDDDDVTRALLAAAAGVTYTRVQGADGREKVRASITKPPLTPVMQQTNSTTPKPTAAAAAVVAAVAPLPNATKVVQTMIAPTVPPPVYRPPLSTNSSAPAQTGKKKRFIRVAAGMTWEDPTLAEWDPNDFRIFCGDLGNEVSDDTLTRAFNRYASFQKAKVVRDKRTGKSRGYGFVSFSDPADFTRAMREMNGKYVGNRPIKLKRSDWRTRQLETYRKKEKEKKKCSTIHILTTEIHALVDPPLRSVATCFSLANRPIAVGEDMSTI